ncbi:hypothetical protein Tco_0966779 [Tanacetum coccineum]
MANIRRFWKSARIRRIFLDGYSVLVFRIVIFKISSFKLQLSLLDYRRIDLRAFVVFDEENLKAKFEWIKTQARKLGIPPSPELIAFGLFDAEKKRKRSSEIIKEFFVKEYIVVDGMHKNLIPPSWVEGSRWLVIREPKSGIFFYNGNFDLVFQREEEFHLATIAQLIRTQSAIQRGTPEAEEIFKKIELIIEAKNDVTKVRRIVKENLDGLGQNV